MANYWDVNTNQYLYANSSKFDGNFGYTTGNTYDNAFTNSIYTSSVNYSNSDNNTALMLKESSVFFNEVADFNNRQKAYSYSGQPESSLQYPEGNNVRTSGNTTTQSSTQTTTQDTTSNSSQVNTDELIDGELKDDTQIQLDLGDGQTATLTYKDLNDNIEAVEKEVAALENALEQAEENVDEDGNSRVTDDTPVSEMSFWQKAGTVGMGLLDGGWKFAKSFFGFEDGWEGFKKGGWKNLLGNVGSIAGAYALSCIPYAGPYIAAAFIWYTRGDAICNAIGIKNPVPLNSYKDLVNLLAIPVKYKDDTLYISGIGYKDGKFCHQKWYDIVRDWLLPLPVRANELEFGWAEGKGIHGLCTAKTAGDLEFAAESIGVAAIEFAGSKGASKGMKAKASKINGTTPKTTTAAPKGIGGRIRNFFKNKVDSIKEENAAIEALRSKEYEMWNLAKQKETGFFKRLKSFNKQKREFNKKYCANTEAYEKQKQQMLDEWVNKNGNNGNKKQGILKRLFNGKGNKNKKFTNVDNEIKKLENDLKTSRKERIECQEKAKMDKARYDKKNSKLQELEKELNDVLDGSKNIKGISNSPDAKIYFRQEMERLIAEEKQFNRQYRQLYRAQQKSMGAQLVRNIDKRNNVKQYTSRDSRFGQLLELNRKPQSMGHLNYTGRLGFKVAWDGSMLMYNGGKAILGKPGSAYLIGRYSTNPEAYKGEFWSAERIEEESQTLYELKQYLEQLKQIKEQTEEYYGTYGN